MKYNLSINNVLEGNVIFYETEEEAAKNIKEEGRRIQFCSDELKHNRELCMMAVKQNGLALQFIPTKMKDKEIVQEAVKENPFAYCCLNDLFSQMTEEEKREYTKELCPLIFSQDPNFEKHASLSYCKLNQDLFWVREAISDFKTTKELEYWEENGRPEPTPVFSDEKEKLQSQEKEISNELNKEQNIKNTKNQNIGEEI